jgi:RND superfamily putative drug exporter
MRSHPPRFGRVVVALRWPILLFWIAAATTATMFLPSIEESQTGALGALVPSHADALDAELRSAELFGFPLLSRTILVQRDPRGLPAAAQALTLSRALALNRDTLKGLNRIGGALPVLNTVSLPPFTREQGTTAITYLYFRPEVGSGERLDLAQRLRALADTSDPRAFSGVTGALAAREAQSRTISERLPLVELLTLLVVVAAVALHYRALLAPLVTVGAVAITYLVAVRVVAWAGGRFGVSVPTEVQPVLVVLLFGVLTDYAIFFLSRFRLRLSEGEAPRDAARRATDELLGTVVAAGVTVAAASAALIVAELGFFETFGPGLAAAVLLALAVAVTLIPASLAILGHSTFWPSRPGRDVPAAEAAEEQPAEREPRPVRSRALRVASERPGPTAFACVVVLLIGASGLLHLHVGQTLIRGLPWGSETHQAYVQASRGFAPGVLSPTTVLVEAPGIVDRRAALIRLQRSIGRLPGVALTVGPAQQPLSTELGAVYSRSRNAVRYLVVFDADPLSAGAIRRLRVLRSRLGTLTAAAGLPQARTSIAGDTALAEETVRLTREDLGRVAPAALLVVFAVLVIFLRALVAPLYLVGASVLALACSLGITVYVFQDLLGYGELTYYVPFVAAVLLVALGSDYNVFLTGRIWQEARHRPLRAAVAVGGSRAASAITVAGLVLALSFAVLALVPVRPFRELAFAMSVGLVVDAFLVRTLLVPSLIALVGARSAWPSRLQPIRPSSAPATVPAMIPAPAPVASRGLARMLIVGLTIGIVLSALGRRR